MLDFKIDTFLSLCETRNYTHTANVLNITQPAVTQHIQYLENMYQTKLFYFDEHRHLHLTENGKLLRSFSQKAKVDSRLFSESLIAKPAERDELKIGTIVTTGESLVPGIVADYLQKYPSKKVSMYLDEADALLIQLKNGRIDFGITDLENLPDLYEQEGFFESETICVCSPLHPLAGKAADFKELNKYRLVFRENDTYSKQNLTKILRAHNQEISNFRSYVEAGTINAVKKMVMEDVGISFAYRFIVQDDLSSGLLSQIYVHDFSSYHKFNLVWLKNSLLTPDSLPFLDLCKSASIAAHNPNLSMYKIM